MTDRKEEPALQWGKSYPLPQNSDGADLTISSQAGHPAFADSKPGKLVFKAGMATTLLELMPERTSFFTPDGKEVLRLEADGSILVRGERAYAKDVVDGMRAWLDSMGMLPK